MCVCVCADELGQWKPACNRFGKEYVEAYHAIIPKAEPVEDYDGRIDLYKLCVYLLWEVKEIIYLSINLLILLSTGGSIPMCQRCLQTTGDSGNSKCIVVVLGSNGK